MRVGCSHPPFADEETQVQGTQLFAPVRGRPESDMSLISTTQQEQSSSRLAQQGCDFKGLPGPSTVPLVLCCILSIVLAQPQPKYQIGAIFFFFNSEGVVLGLELMALCLLGRNYHLNHSVSAEIRAIGN